MEPKEKTVSDCFRLGKEQPDKPRTLVFYVPCPWYHKLIFVIEKAREFKYVYQGIYGLCGLSVRKENSKI